MIEIYDKNEDRVKNVNKVKISNKDITAIIKGDNLVYWDGTAPSRFKSYGYNTSLANIYNVCNSDENIFNFVDEYPTNSDYIYTIKLLGGPLLALYTNHGYCNKNPNRLHYYDVYLGSSLNINGDLVSASGEKMGYYLHLELLEPDGCASFRIELRLKHSIGSSETDYTSHFIKMGDGLYLKYKNGNTNNYDNIKYTKSTSTSIKSIITRGPTNNIVIFMWYGGGGLMGYPLLYRIELAENKPELNIFDNGVDVSLEIGHQITSNLHAGEKSYSELIKILKDNDVVNNTTTVLSPSKVLNASGDSTINSTSTINFVKNYFKIPIRVDLPDGLTFTDDTNSFTMGKAQTFITKFYRVDKGYYIDVKDGSIIFNNGVVKAVINKSINLIIFFRDTSYNGEVSEIYINLEDMGILKEYVYTIKIYSEEEADLQGGGTGSMFTFTEQSFSDGYNPCTITLKKSKPESVVFVNMHKYAVEFPEYNWGINETINGMSGYGTYFEFDTNSYGKDYFTLKLSELTGAPTEDKEFEVKIYRAQKELTIKCWNAVTKSWLGNPFKVKGTIQGDASGISGLIWNSLYGCNFKIDTDNGIGGCWKMSYLDPSKASTDLKEYNCFTSSETNEVFQFTETEYARSAAGLIPSGIAGYYYYFNAWLNESSNSINIRYGDISGNTIYEGYIKEDVTIYFILDTEP